MTTRTGSGTLDAYIVGGRWRHDRDHDHEGSDSDLYTAISAPIGPWNEGTPIFYVVQDIFMRLSQLEAGNRKVLSFGLDSLIAQYYALDSVILSPGLSGNWTWDAWLCGGGAYGLDAVIRGGGSYGLDAFIV